MQKSNDTAAAGRPAANPPAEITTSAAYETHQPSAAAPPNVPESLPAFGPPQRPEEIGTLGPYRVVKELGRGGMGAVYLAFDERLHRKVALKVMPPQYAAVASSRRRFLREARAAASITHDNIVTVYEADERDGVTYLTMQLLQGKPLDVYLKEKGGLKIREAVRVVRETALGLAAAHARGLVHRDVKPGNLWLEAPKGRVKILDFGLAKPTEAAAPDADLTATGAIMGTPSYMAPEQALGGAVDFRADLYSLGVVLYRLSANRLPFTGSTATAVLAAVLTEEPPPIRDLNPAVPEPLAKLVHQLLAKKPTDRPASAAKVAEELRQIELGQTVAPPAQPLPLESLPTATRVPPGADHFARLDATEEDSAESPAAPVARRRRTPKWPLVALGLLLLAGVAAVLPQIITVTTPKGTLVIEASDPDVEITVKKDGAVIVDKSKNREIALSIGDYTIAVAEKDGLKLSTDKFEITKNGKTTVAVRLDKPAVATAVQKPVPNTAPLPRAEKPLAPTPKGNADADRAVAELVHEAGGTIRIAIGGEERSIYLADPLPAGAFGLLEVMGHEDLKFDRAFAEKFRQVQEVRTLVTPVGSLTADGLEALSTTPVAKSLIGLACTHTVLKDADFAPLVRFQNLKSIDITGKELSDAVLDHVAKLPRLEAVHLSKTGVTENGLRKLKDVSLSAIYLNDCKGVTDAALAELTGHLNLRLVEVVGTGVTEAGVRRLSASLPRCRIAWDGGTIEPVGAADRRSADYVLSVGGAVSIKDPPVWMNDRDALPGVPFVVSGVDFRASDKVTDAGLACFQGCTGVKRLLLEGTSIGDDGVAQFTRARNLRVVSLAGTRVTDKGLEVLAGCQDLKELDLRKATGITMGAVRKLATVLPKCKITWDGGETKPAK
ncbi:protein kinase domain-containing protein [Limnoglobus roseus]|uniref:non-specific serine/threonine protein kinase n=1 Tax=Limnoglobus roseus TaxID=2598579 RepID=A0A5C1AP07_9BACT|nr:protein kinase [Limnoglobus roseus]QEL18598.1 serine/threonine protein kinase [Limnoglobus roseus]